VTDKPPAEPSPAGSASAQPARKAGARPAICFAGCIPPPVHGMSSVNLAMIERLSDRCPVAVFGVMEGHHTGLAGRVVKALRALRAVFGILASGLAGVRVFYGSVDDKLGGYYTAAYLLAARLFGMRLFLHYHSFYYVDRTTLPMRLVTRIAGASACHIMLCDCMGEKFLARYPAARRFVSVPNTADLPPGAANPGTAGDNRPLTLGFMCNLTFDKGLDTFTELVERARGQGLPVRGLLAGPAEAPEVRRHVEVAQASLGDALEWMGPVSGESKRRFFEQTDVFVFPTRYRTEAYPLVIVEALCMGLPVITIDRGCIGEFAALEACTVQPRDGDFVTASLPKVAEFSRNPALLEQAKRVAAREGRRIGDANRAAGEKLIDEIVAVATR
jgi:glycosyltransferase involved in cell wall biosynthesis